jgi:hypothetical protein
MLKNTISKWLQFARIYRRSDPGPEPKMVVDLRDSVALRPVIATTGRVLRWLLPAVVSAAFIRTTAHLTTLALDRPIRKASICLAILVATGVALLALTGGLNGTTLSVALVGGAIAIAGLPVRATVEDIREHPITQEVLRVLEPYQLPKAK